MEINRCNSLAVVYFGNRYQMLRTHKSETHNEPCSFSVLDPSLVKLTKSHQFKKG